MAAAYLARCSGSMEVQIGSRVLALTEGDITRFPADALVNAANSQLIGGGGVDGAIHRAGGPAIMRELDEIRPKIGRCPAGSAVVTGAGHLPARCVIHAVGPIFRDGRHGEPELLASCYRTSLELAQQHGARTVAFPSISTGVYGYPLEAAATIAIRTVAEYLRRPTCLIERVTIVLFGQAAFEAHRRILETYASH
jgi:O-acetyl-ADP-ribose deacetylase (regulator of RNase III)